MRVQCSHCDASVDRAGLDAFPMVLDLYVSAAIKSPLLLRFRTVVHSPQRIERYSTGGKGNGF